MSSRKVAHNLKIETYSLPELLDLFQLSYTMSMDDLKRAKKIVLMTHPDKSGLRSDYFLFYKKAFDIIVQFYQEQQRTNQIVPTEEPKYEPMNTNTNKSATKQVTSVINKMTPQEFNSTFNKLFDDTMSTKINTSKNDWFSKDESIYEVEGVNKQNMGQMFEQVKAKQNASTLSKYRSIETLSTGNGFSSNLYDDEDEDEYVQCDPFSKLKFDDLRKVHKDQTVLAVSEKDIEKIPLYKSTEHYMQVRGQQYLTPFNKNEAEHMLSSKEEMFKKTMMQKEYQANLKTMEYEQKNKTVLSSFLQLRN
jgi:hypothetical protein